MVESLTQNYHWTKPEVTKSASTWGGFLNTDLDSIDALVYANQQGIVPVGAVTMFAGATAPTNWLICDGRSLDTTAYAALFAVLQYAHGGSGANFNLPNLQGVFPLGAGPSNAVGSAAGSYNYTLDVAHLPPHAHPIIDVAHNHTASQPAHNHADQGHGHGVTESQHTHQVGVVVGGGSGVAAGAGNSFQTTQTGGAVSTGLSIQAGYANLAAAQPAITVAASGTGLSTTQNVGSGAAMSIVPSYVALNFIIRFS